MSCSNWSGSIKVCFTLISRESFTSAISFMDSPTSINALPSTKNTNRKGYLADLNLSKQWYLFNSFPKFCDDQWCETRSSVWDLWILTQRKENVKTRKSFYFTHFPHCFCTFHCRGLKPKLRQTEALTVSVTRGG